MKEYKILTGKDDNGRDVFRVVNDAGICVLRTRSREEADAKLLWLTKNLNAHAAWRRQTARA